MELVAQCWVFRDSTSPLELKRLVIPPLRANELVVELSAVTICGSDIHTIDGKRKDPAAPLILGHEGVGRIVASHSSLSAPLAIGSRVSFSIISSCNACEMCTPPIRLPQKCRTVVKYGHASFLGDRLLGCYSSHIVLSLPGTRIIALPEHVPDAIAAPANCALATIMSAWKKVVSNLGAVPKNILVLGCGLLGLYCCSVAAHAGSRIIFATDISSARRKLALEFGATSAVASISTSSSSMAHTGNSSSGGGGGESSSELETPSTTCSASNLSSIPPPGASETLEFDAIFEVCGVVQPLKDALRALRPGGVCSLIGLVHPDSDLAGITAEMLIRKSATIFGIHNYSGDDLEDGIAFLASALSKHSGDPLQHPFHQITSPPFALEALPDAIALAKTGAFPRVLVTPRACK